MERRDLEVGIQETPHQELKQQRRRVGINKPPTHLFKDPRGLKAKSLQLLQPFSGSFCHALPHSVLDFVPCLTKHLLGLAEILQQPLE